MSTSNEQFEVVLSFSCETSQGQKTRPTSVKEKKVNVAGIIEHASNRQLKKQYKVVTGNGSTLFTMK